MARALLDETQQTASVQLQAKEVALQDKAIELAAKAAEIARKDFKIEVLTHDGLLQAYPF